jgi:serine/threonine protein kinase
MNTPTFDPNHPHTDGTLRWQAPELMAGGNSQFFAPMDVYAFAICCIEILTKGGLPWPLLDDDAVRHLVLSVFISI